MGSGKVRVCVIITVSDICARDKGLEEQFFYLRSSVLTFDRLLLFTSFCMFRFSPGRTVFSQRSLYISEVACSVSLNSWL
jgi:hypothetical protein